MVSRLAPKTSCSLTDEEHLGTAEDGFDPLTIHRAYDHLNGGAELQLQLFF